MYPPNNYNGYPPSDSYGNSGGYPPAPSYGDDGYRSMGYAPDNNDDCCRSFGGGRPPNNQYSNSNNPAVGSGPLSFQMPGAPSGYAGPGGFGGGGQPGGFAVPSSSPSDFGAYPPAQNYGGGGGYPPRQQNFGPGGGGVYPPQNNMGPPQNMAYKHEGFYIGRRKHKDSVQVGMVVESKGGLLVAYDGKALLFRDGYEILCGPSSLVKWTPANGKLDPAKLADKTHQPLVCGNEKNGEKLYAATTTLNGRDYAGKAGAKTKGILFVQDGCEHRAKDYFVLCEVKAAGLAR
ncbi:hypothetical protein GGI19_002893 [Coemansia pectinata]|uniref:Uncharacterized protein n=1 Tax=Coemansia pectinata TaxID=1052879 RepID=A0A9W8GZ01_9FUNG|nr:hypothetical protein GGI19_002893 [Coemansia pectinata]